jgi:hypothetical protein
VLDTTVLQPVTKMSTTARLSVLNKCRDSSVSIVTRVRAGRQEIRGSIEKQSPYCPWVRRLSSQWITVSLPGVQRSMRVTRLYLQPNAITERPTPSLFSISSRNGA